jgi:hypothetical protein
MEQGQVIMGYEIKCYCDTCGAEISSGTGASIRIEVGTLLSERKKNRLKNSMKVLCEECITKAISALGE